MKILLKITEYLLLYGESIIVSSVCNILFKRKKIGGKTDGNNYKGNDNR